VTFVAASRFCAVAADTGAAAAAAAAPSADVAAAGASKVAAGAGVITVPFKVASDDMAVDGLGVCSDTRWLSSPRPASSSVEEEFGAASVGAGRSVTG
jgi:hypothetical protein